MRNPKNSNAILKSNYFRDYANTNALEFLSVVLVDLAVAVLVHAIGVISQGCLSERRLVRADIRERTGGAILLHDTCVSSTEL